ncbi:hypothetical protein A1232T_02301 [Psychrobacter piechaudii]|uniref:DUF7944 domain-containing protein n=2 Tax=Psychrobacter piechaudii TaxID=1945521 RepID=A0A1R4GY67_9GAMM|nr:hypothetical protein A1232T_02301 [Psychrobacter piechaudii]
MSMKKLMTSLLSNTVLSSSVSSSAGKLALSAVIGSVALIGSTLAQAAQTTIPVDLSRATATKHEIAVLQVLSEVCPPMLNRQQRQNFQKTYNQQLKQMLPSIDNPKAAIRYLSTQQDYRTILSSMRNWTLSYSRDENLALCTDLASADF